MSSQVYYDCVCRVLGRSCHPVYLTLPGPGDLSPPTTGPDYNITLHFQSPKETQQSLFSYWWQHPWVLVYVYNIIFIWIGKTFLGAFILNSCRYPMCDSFDAGNHSTSGMWSLGTIVTRGSNGNSGFHSKGEKWDTWASSLSWICMKV